MLKPDTPAQESTEQRIFDAAREVFVQKGLDGAKMQEIADRAGINKALLHYYYRSKEKLYETVARAIISRAVSAIHQTLNAEEPLEAKIGRLIDFYIDVLGRNTFVLVFVISEMNKHPRHFREHILPGELPRPQVFFRQVEEAVQEGRIRPVDPEHLLVSIISMSVFPFLAQPMVQIVLGKSPAEMEQFLKARKTAVREQLFAGLRTERHP